MRTIAAGVLLVLVVAAPGALAGQDESLLVFQRVCNIEPGGEATAAALAREMTALGARNYPGAEISVTIGRWMTGFQNIDQPVDQILFRESHADEAMRQDFNEILLADDEFRDLQRKLVDVIDFGSCTETSFRARY